MRRWMLEFLVVCFALTIASLSASALAQSSKVTTVRLADQPGAEDDYAAIWIAEMLGYYQKEGIKICRRTYPNGPAGLLDFASWGNAVEMAAVVPSPRIVVADEQFQR